MGPWILESFDGYLRLVTVRVPEDRSDGRLSIKQEQTTAGSWVLFCWGCNTFYHPLFTFHKLLHDCGPVQHTAFPRILLETVGCPGKTYRSLWYPVIQLWTITHWCFTDGHVQWLCWADMHGPVSTAMIIKSSSHAPFPYFFPVYAGVIPHVVWYCHPYPLVCCGCSSILNSNNCQWS